MTDIQYNQYNIIQSFAVNWRKYTPNFEPLEKEAFRRAMQLDKYVRLDYINPKNGKQVIIFLFAPDSPHATSSTMLKRILVRVKDPGDIILVMKKYLGSYSKIALKSFPHLRVKCYLHENFNIIIPNGPLCYKHRILSTEEVNTLLNTELYCYLVNLPKILIDDPQCIWLGCEIGDVLEITSPSEIAGEYVHYRVVCPKNGAAINIADVRDDKKTDHFRSRQNSIDTTADDTQTVIDEPIDNESVTADNEESQQPHADHVEEELEHAEDIIIDDGNTSDDNDDEEVEDIDV
jgi:DNA-directed RNA polymerase subunit H (RpoH/RPB5)